METQRRKRTRGIDCMRIEKIVGSGTFGVVYKAVDKTDNFVEVALKRIRMERETQGFPVTAIREIRILNLMRDHPNIVHLREIVYYDETCNKESSLVDKKFQSGDVFMVFEFVDYDLSGLLKSSGITLTEQHAKCYLEQLLRGVQYLHDNGVLHRDIKSANLLVTKNNVLKIADWGLARTLPDDIAGTAKLTNPVVTLWYRSPEVIVGSKRYNKGVDIWSVGCIFGEMRTRVAMFRSETELAQLELIFQVTGYPQGDALKQYEAIEQWPAFSHVQNNAQNCFLAKYGSGKNKYFDSIGLDLLQRLLDIDPTRRISADNALEHEYFRDPVPPSQLPVISIAPVTEWMEQERARAEHEQQKLRHQHKERERLEAAAAAAAISAAQQQAQSNVPKHQAIMRNQGNAKVVGRYTILKKSNTNSNKTNGNNNNNDSSEK